MTCGFRKMKVAGYFLNFICVLSKKTRYWAIIQSPEV